MENNVRTDEQLRNVLQEFEVLPDETSFDAILEKMRRKKKRRAFILFFTTGAIALTALAICLFSYSLVSSPSQANQGKEAIVSTSVTTSDSLNHNTSQNNETALNQQVATTLGTSSNIHAGTDKEATGTLSTTTPDHANGRTSQVNEAAQKPTASPLLTKHKARVMPEHVQTHPTGMDQPGGASPEKRSIATTGNKGGQANRSGNKTAGQTQRSGQDTGTLPAKTEDERMLSSDKTLKGFSGRQADPMPLMHAAWPSDTIFPEITTGITQASSLSFVPTTFHKKNISFFLGFHVNPQLNHFVFSGNPNADPLYNSGGSNFSSLYLDAKQRQRGYNLQVPFGIKAGIRLNNSYEFLVGFGLQSFKEKEYLYATGPATVTPPPTTLPLAYSSGGYGSVPFINVFRYYGYSLEASRFFHSLHFLQFKLGIGLYANQLRKADYVYAEAPYLYKQASGREAVSSWLFTGKIKGGIILNGNKRFQVHVSPGVFYSPTSIFKKGYAIRQKPYGFDLECLFLFRLSKN